MGESTFPPDPVGPSRTWGGLSGGVTRRVDIPGGLPPKGEKTEVTVVGDFASSSIPVARLERTVLDVFERIYDEDSAAIRTRVSQK